MGIYSVNTVIVAFLGGSDAANDPAWAIYFLIIHRNSPSGSSWDEVPPCILRGSVVH